MRRLAPLLVLLVFFASACRIQSELTIEVRADGSGEVRAELGYDAAAAGFIEEYGAGTLPLRSTILAGFRDAEERREERDGLTFVIAAATTDDLEAALRLMAVAPAALIERPRLILSRHRLEISGRAGLAGLLERVAAVSPADAPAPAVEARLRLDLPGNILSHNADDREGNTLIWVLPAGGEDISFRAVTDPAEGLPFPLWALIALAGLVVAAIAVVVVRGRRAGPGAPPPGPELQSP